MAMASKTILLALIATTVTLLIVSYFLWDRDTKEGFQSPAYSVDVLQINTCPIFATEIQTAKGSTDCCQGEMIDGQCNGTTFCTKSPAYLGVPNCIDAWRQYFTKKGNDICPSTMPNYYEDVTNPSSQKGCSAGPISSDGKMPTDTTRKQCKIYSSEEDNKTKLDSCYVEKQRSKVQCPAINMISPSAALYPDWRDNTRYLAITCDYPFELGMPVQCFDRASLESYLDNAFPNWRTSTRDVNWVNTNACDNYLTRRESSRTEANRLQEEERKRKEAQDAATASNKAREVAEADAKKRAEEASRLQQQLDEANRKLQQCK
jgi:hypothetical protein